MKSTNTCIAFLIFVSCGIQSHARSHPFLNWISEPYIVISDHASPVEYDTAEQIAKRGGWDSGSVIVTDTWILRHTDEAAIRDLIVIGTETGNSVFQSHPSTWTRSVTHSSESDIPAGLFVFGIGTISDPHAGFIEPGRNPFTVLAADIASHEGTSPPSPRWMLRICGVSPRGVRRAAEVLLTDFMLSGVVFSGDDPAGRKPFILNSNELSGFPKNWQIQSPVQEYSFIGWHQSDALLFSGLEARIGSRPSGAWRFAYRKKSEPRSASDSPHRSNSVSEILAIAMTDPADALRGGKALLAEFGVVHEKRTGNGVFLKVFEGDFSHTALIHESFILLENFAEANGDIFLTSLVGG